MKEVPFAEGHLIDTIPMAALFLDRDLYIKAANGDFYALFTLDKEILNRPVHEIVPDDALKEQVEEVMVGGGRKESRLLLPSGLELRVVMKRAPLSTDGVVILMEELSERIWLEEKFLQAEKLFAMGQLATCITHEVGNPLGIMKSTMRFLSDHLAGMGDDLNTYGQVMMENIDRMHDLLKDIAQFAKPGKEQVVFCDIRNSLLDTLRFVEKECEGHGVAMEISFEDDLPMLCCNPNRVKQVFLNLVKNAIEAMPNGGRLSVTANVVAADIEGNDAVLLKFTDNGVGISIEDMKTLFKPFHTTKSSGNGLGLFIVRSIVREYNGRIEVNSIKGVGTTVSILLPVEGGREENA